jgi:uncharacterized protein YjeT (DUF2065 family)
MILTHILLAFGLVMVVEGLVFALAPQRLDELVKLISEIPLETRRMLGLACVAGGVVLVWLAKGAFGA